MMAVTHSVKMSLNALSLSKAGVSLDLYGEDSWVKSRKVKLGTLVITPGSLRWKVGNRRPIRVSWESLSSRLIGR